MEASISTLLVPLEHLGDNHLDDSWLSSTSDETWEMKGPWNPHASNDIGLIILHKNGTS